MKNIVEIIKSSKQRIVSAIFMILALVLFISLDNHFLTWLVLGIIYLIAFFESCKLFTIEETNLYLIAFVLWLVCFFFPSPLIFAILVILIITSSMLNKGAVNFKILLPFLYPSIPLLILYTQYLYFGMFSIIWLILIVASCDVGAYFIGKAVGKTKFSPISPNKTKEGTYGGILLASIVGTIYAMSLFSFLTSLIVSFLTSFAGVYGDLFESYLKRKANVKDSGNIFPGHGGMLDRIDSYLFATIVMTAFLQGFVA